MPEPGESDNTDGPDVSLASRGEVVGAGATAPGPLGEVVTAGSGGSTGSAGSTGAAPLDTGSLGSGSLGAESLAGGSTGAASLTAESLGAGSVDGQPNPRARAAFDGGAEEDRVFTTISGHPKPVTTTVGLETGEVTRDAPSNGRPGGSSQDSTPGCEVST